MIADWSRGTRGITCFHLAVAGRLAYVPPTGPELGPILCFTSGGNLLLLALSFPSSQARQFFYPTSNIQLATLYLSNPSTALLLLLCRGCVSYLGGGTYLRLLVLSEILEQDNHHNGNCRVLM